MTRAITKLVDETLAGATFDEERAGVIADWCETAGLSEGAAILRSHPEEGDVITDSTAILYLQRKARALQALRRLLEVGLDPDGDPKAEFLTTAPARRSEPIYGPVPSAVLVSEITFGRNYPDAFGRQYYLGPLQRQHEGTRPCKADILYSAGNVEDGVPAQLIAQILLPAPTTAGEDVVAFTFPAPVILPPGSTLFALLPLGWAVRSAIVGSY